MEASSSDKSADHSIEGFDPTRSVIVSSLPAHLNEGQIFQAYSCHGNITRVKNIEQPLFSTHKTMVIEFAFEQNALAAVQNGVQPQHQAMVQQAVVKLLKEATPQDLGAAQEQTKEISARILHVKNLKNAEDLREKLIQIVAAIARAKNVSVIQKPAVAGAAASVIPAQAIIEFESEDEGEKFLVEYAKSTHFEALFVNQRMHGCVNLYMPYEDRQSYKQIKQPKKTWQQQVDAQPHSEGIQRAVRNNYEFSLSNIQQRLDLNTRGEQSLQQTISPSQYTYGNQNNQRAVQYQNQYSYQQQQYYVPRQQQFAYGVAAAPPGIEPQRGAQNAQSRLENYATLDSIKDNLAQFKSEPMAVQKYALASIAKPKIAQIGYDPAQCEALAKKIVNQHITQINQLILIVENRNQELDRLVQQMANQQQR